MPFEAGTLIILALLGGVVAVDGTSFGQFMVSRPLVSASLAGFVAGDPVHGALIGLVLEAFHLTVLPVGAAKFPEGGPAAVAGGAMYATSDFAASTLLLIVIFALALEWLGGESVRFMRQGNGRLMTRGRTLVMTAGALEWRHLLAIGFDFVRGMLLVIAGSLILSGALRVLAPLWGLGERIPQVLLSAVVAGLIASTFRTLGSPGWLTAVGAGAGITFLLLVV